MFEEIQKNKFNLKLLWESALYSFSPKEPLLILLYNFLLKLRHDDFFRTKWNELKDYLSSTISDISNNLSNPNINPEIKEQWKIKISYYENLLNSIMGQ